MRLYTQKQGTHRVPCFICSEPGGLRLVGFSFAAHALQQLPEGVVLGFVGTTARRIGTYACLQRQRRAHDFHAVATVDLLGFLGGERGFHGVHFLEKLFQRAGWLHGVEQLALVAELQPAVR